MGIALRSNIPLSINLPSLFWKELVGDQTDESDLEAIDHTVCKHLTELKEVKEEDFDEKFGPNSNSPFTFTIFAGNTWFDLIPGGSTMPVTFENRIQYINKVIAHRLKESSLQINSIKEGLANIIPISVLSTCTWQELELVVCGSPVIDFEFLKQHTVYEGVNASSPHIQYFWETLSKLKEEHHADFLRFVWARSRLPKHLEMNFKIQGPPPRSIDNPDKYLPTSQTCFFSISIPQYSSQEKMYDRLLYAIKHCVDMDADFRVH